VYENHASPIVFIISVALLNSGISQPGQKQRKSLKPTHEIGLMQEN
jgi:hypothetical protein